MCRLFGVRADSPVEVEDPLCRAHNALRAQARAHRDGWGIGWYERGLPRIARGTGAACEDRRFARAAGGVRSRAVVAHVRAKSCGPVCAENTHPFVHGRWLFCHNGTVARFAHVRARLEAEIDPALRALVAGDTDSERCFYAFLTRLSARARLDRAGVEHVVAALGETVELVRRLADPGAKKPSSTNFLVTDGRVLAACRLGRTLFADAGPGRLAVASERIGAAAWIEVPELGFAASDGGRPVLGKLPAPRRAA